MAIKDVCCYLGAGVLSVAKKSSYDAGLSGLREFGNTKDFTITPTVSETKTPNFMTRAGGDACVTQIIESVMVKFTAICHKMDNLALALYGDYTEVATAAVVNEALVAFEGSIVPLSNLPNLSIAPVVTDAATDLITYVEGVDYSFTEAGALIILDGTTIPVPLLGVPNIHVDYTKVAQQDLQMFTRVSDELVLFFSGTNRDDTGQLAQLKLFKVKLKTAPFDLIKDGKTTSELVFEGVVIADENVPAAGGFSQFGQFLRSKV